MDAGKSARLPQYPPQPAGPWLLAGSGGSRSLPRSSAQANPTFTRRSAPPPPSPRPLPAQVRAATAPPPALQWRRGGESERHPGRGRSRAGVWASAGTLGGGACGIAMGVEIETISPGDGTGRGAGGRGRVPRRSWAGGGLIRGWRGGCRNVRRAEAGGTEETPDGIAGGLRRSLLSVPRQLTYRSAGGGREAGVCGPLRPGGRRLPRLEPLGYPLLRISRGQVLAPLFLPCWASPRKRGRTCLGGSSAQAPPLLTRPPPSARWAVRRCGDPASLGRDLPSPCPPASRFILLAPFSLSNHPVRSPGSQYPLQTDGLQT